MKTPIRKKLLLAALCFIAVAASADASFAGTKTIYGNAETPGECRALLFNQCRALGGKITIKIKDIPATCATNVYDFFISSGMEALVSCNCSATCAF